MPVTRLTLIALLLSSAAASADAQWKRHLSHEDLMTLAPFPDVRPTFGPEGEHVSGGIGILVYDGVNVMDAIGPYQVFSTAALRPILISASHDGDGDYDTRVTANSGVELTAHTTIAEVSELDVLVVAGGVLETALIAMDPELIAWVQAIDETTTWTTSVCTGSWVLGAAGILAGKHATSNWYRADELLTHFGALARTHRRYVFDGKVATSAGVTAGIDMALAIVKRLFRGDLNGGRDYTQAVMLDLEYDPNPPVRGGSPGKTHPYVRQGMLEMYDHFGIGELVKNIPTIQ